MHINIYIIYIYLSVLHVYFDMYQREYDYICVTLGMHNFLEKYYTRIF